MEAIENVIITPIKNILSQTGLATDLMLAICGVAVVFVFFLIALIFKGLSKTKAFTKKLAANTEFLIKSEEISEENVEGLHNNLKALPESVQKGWGCFLEQKYGYPSDYITSRDVLADKSYSGKNTAGKVFFRVFSAIAIILTIWLEFVINKGASLSTVGISDFTTNFQLVAAIIAVFCAPLLAYIIFNAVLSATYNKQYKNLEKQFSEFQNVLDSKVIIYAEEEDEFVSENIGEINAAIEEIIANKIDNKEIIEVVTVPQVEELEVIISAIEPEQPVPIEEVPAEEEEEEDTPEQKQKRLEGLVEIIDMAVFKDKKVTKAEIEELAIIINNEKEYSHRDEKDKAILEECLIKLSNKYQSFK